MRRRPFITLFPAILVFTCMLISGGGAQAHASTLQCNDGTWNQRLVTTGSCAWGHVNTGNFGARYWVDFNMVVVDTANDGRCVHFDRRDRIRGTTIGASTTVMARACGYGNHSVAQGRDDWLSIFEAVDIRVCTTGLSCTAWKRVF